MSRTLFKALGLVSLCLFMLLSYNGEAAAKASQPLQIELDEHGQLSVKLWHWQQPFSPVFDYYHQYRVSDNPAFPDAVPEWGTWLTFTDHRQDEPVLYHHAGQALSSSLSGQTRNYLFGEGALVRHETDDYLELSVTWLLAEHDLKLTQNVLYDKSAWHFFINWQIENTGDQVYEAFYLTHGGISHLYQQTRHRSSWDETGSRLILWPEDRWASGLMLMGGGLSSPVDSYYAGSSASLLSVPRHQRLPDDAAPGFTDHGLLVQWHQPQLAPGEQWTLDTWQQFTAPVSLSLDLPETVEAHPGSKVILEGSLIYTGDQVELPEIAAWCLAPGLIEACCDEQRDRLNLILDASAPPEITLGLPAVSEQGAGGFIWPVEVTWQVPDCVLLGDCLCTAKAGAPDQQDSPGDMDDLGCFGDNRCETLTIRLTAQTKHNLDLYTVFSAAADLVITHRQMPEQPEPPEPEPEPDPDTPEPEPPEPEPDMPDEPDPAEENKPEEPEDPGSIEEDLPDKPDTPCVPDASSEQKKDPDRKPTESPETPAEPETKQPQSDDFETQTEEEIPVSSDQPGSTPDLKPPETELVQNPKTGDTLYLQLQKTKQRLMKITAPFQALCETVGEQPHLTQAKNNADRLSQSPLISSSFWLAWLLMVITFNLLLHQSGSDNLSGT